MTLRHDYEATSGVIERLVRDAGGAKRAAFLLGLKNEFSIYPGMNPDKPDQMSFDRVRRLTEVTGSPEAAQDLARLAGGVFLPTSSDASMRQLATLTAQECGKYSALLIDAFADGVVDASESASLLPEIDRLIQHLAAQRVKIANGNGGK